MVVIEYFIPRKKFILADIPHAIFIMLEIHLVILFVVE